ncbi:MAG: arginine-tRNA-protein transferase, partial [Candidatus Binatia bacterium]
IRPIRITDAVERLFDTHKIRFDHAIPNSIRDFISNEPADVPCEAFEVCVFDDETLVAASYVDIGANSTSGIYAMFEPRESRRGLGIFTMLKEIEFARQAGKEFYYQGYCYEGESFYDYKKRFRGTEGYDWAGQWQSLSVM